MNAKDTAAAQEKLALTLDGIQQNLFAAQCLLAALRKKRRLKKVRLKVRFLNEPQG